MPSLEKILMQAPSNLNTLIASGDVLVKFPGIPDIPDAEIVCVGFKGGYETASRHGVFITRKQDPGKLYRMLQKPDPLIVANFEKEFHVFIDAGIWLMSDKAIHALLGKCGWDKRSGNFRDGVPCYYDLYSQYGAALGDSPLIPDPVISKLPVAVLAPDDFQFYHFGTTADLLSSLHRLGEEPGIIGSFENEQHQIKKDIYIQHSDFNAIIDDHPEQIWVDNSYVASGWSIHKRSVITGVPENDWKLDIPEGTCLDFIPVNGEEICFRFYGIGDAFKGGLTDPETQWLNQPAMQWFEKRLITPERWEFSKSKDIHKTPLFPVFRKSEINEGFLQWLIDLNPEVNREFSALYVKLKRLSSAEVNNAVDFNRYFGQRAVVTDQALQGFRAKIIELISSKRGKSFRSAAFGILRKNLTDLVLQEPVLPLWKDGKRSSLTGESPLRIDLAGGWTDTPPYCIFEGGKVVNVAVELKGKKPVQVDITPSAVNVIRLNSIDTGRTEDVTTFNDLADHSAIGSVFSIAKAALCLAGFHPRFCRKNYKSLADQLTESGGGFELDFLSDVPQGSGLGTSSILAAAILGTLSECFNLGWDSHEICFLTLVLEQLITTGGGWQDQYGGMLKGIKLLETRPGLLQQASVTYAPDTLFTNPAYKPLILLYYTGITRVAKKILAEIVEGMFLNSSRHLGILREMKEHALRTFSALQQNNMKSLTDSVAHSWELNQRLDKGTCTPQIAKILAKVEDLTAGYKLAGAGGGGFLLMFAKDPEAAERIRKILSQDPPNSADAFMIFRFPHAD